MERIVPVLLEVAKELREERDIKPHELPGLLGKTTDALKANERRESFGREVDEWANGLARAGGVSVNKLWELTLERAKDSPRFELTRAELDAADAEAAIQAADSAAQESLKDDH